MMSKMAILTPFSLSSFTTCSPIPPDPPVMSTTSFPRQSLLSRQNRVPPRVPQKGWIGAARGAGPKTYYWSLVQLFSTRDEYHLLSKRARPR